MQEIELAPAEDKIDRSMLEGLVKRRFFYGPSFSIYGGMECLPILVAHAFIQCFFPRVLTVCTGIAGLYDFGPMGCSMKANMLNLWRQHFVLEESMLEVDCTILTPEKVLRVSGHVEKFADLMVKDVVTGECYRADHLLTQSLEKLAAAPSCSSEQKEEYDSVSRQVC